MTAIIRTSALMRFAVFCWHCTLTFEAYTCLLETVSGNVDEFVSGDLNLTPVFVIVDNGNAALKYSTIVLLSC